MKKVLSTVLALGLVAGVASTAAAAYDSFSITGYYTLQGFYAENMLYGTGADLGTKGSPNDDNNAAFWRQDSRLYPTLKVNDKITFASELRLMDTDIWGTTDTTNGPHVAAGSTTTVANGRSLDINKLYMTYVSPVGTVTVGRIPFGTYGHSAFNNSAGREDGIKLATNFLPKPFALTLVTAKQDEGDHSSDISNDMDNDFYSVHLDYKTDTVMAGARYVYTDYQFAPATNTTGQALQAYGKMTIDNIWVGGEMIHNFGETTPEFGTTTDADSTALMLEVGTKFGSLDAGLTYWWISGDNNSADNDNEAFGDAGSDWQPLLIMTHEHMGVLNNKLNDAFTTGNFTGAGSDTVQSAGANVIMATFGMPVSDKLSVNSKLAYGWADSEETGWDDDYGYEIDLGLSYKLLDNLTYGANFGYWAAGDFFTKQGTTAEVTEEDSVMLLHHSLNMTF